MGRWLSVLVATSFLISAHVAIRRDAQEDIDEDTAVVNLDQRFTHGLHVLRQTGNSSFIIELINSMFDSAQAVLDSLRIAVTSTTNAALGIWNALTSALAGIVGGVTALVQAVQALVDVIVQLVNIVLIPVNAIAGVLKGGDTLELDAKMRVLKASTFDNITSRALTTTQSLRVILTEANHSMLEIASVRDMAGFAVKAKTSTRGGPIITEYSRHASALLESSTRHVATNRFGFSGVPWFQNAWRHAKESVLETTSSSLPGALETCDTVEDKLSRSNAYFSSLVDAGFDDMTPADKKEYVATHREELTVNFVEVGSEMEQLSNFAENTVKGIVSNISDIAESFKEDADTFEPGTIDKSKCAWRSYRFFSRSEGVDETTMKCSTFFSRKFCRCKERGRCYVTRQDRPEPVGIARCFKPITVTDDDFYQGS
eukprot:TRINITY_DN6010_c0_g1_i1.p1 TRINITY_DN6010_c0_g1~~TRINITY_DN6010_c0_g1_i1.p1  ORF type:complete len:429 (+),score=43.99 TRINITY_DN6010_c0_g1_i1:168-1454(+)